MKVKKLLSLLSAGAMALTSLTGAMTFTASAANEDDYFTYNNFSGAYLASLKTDVDLSGVSELVVPDTFNGSDGELSVDLMTLALFSPNSTIKTVKTKSSIGSENGNAFSGLNALEKVEYTNPNILTFNQRTFGSCSSTLKDVIIHASKVEFGSGRFAVRAFEGFISNDGAKIHVASDEVKQQIVDGTKDGSAPVSEDKIEVDPSLASSLPTAEVEITCEEDSITYGTKGGFKPTVTVKVSGQPVEDAKYTIKLYRDQDCRDEFAPGCNYDKIPVGTYYLKAVVEGTDTYVGNSAVKEVQVTEVVVDKTNLNKAIEEAESFKSSAVEKDYDPEAWLAVYGTGNNVNDSAALPSAKRVANKEDSQTQDDIDAATKTLTDAMDKLKKSPADTTAEWAKLQELISKAESNRADYTAESYAAQESVFSDAKALSKETATKTVIDEMITKVDRALRNLVGAVPAGDPFAYVRKKGSLTTIISGTADESLEGTASIKFTFDCASDVSFNNDASIDLQAEIDGEKSYVRRNGADGVKDVGFKGRMAVLDLANPIKAGQSIMLVAFTYTWDNASDYVYGITKVEFIDAKGHIIKTMNDVSIAKENLASAIKNAKALSADDYTAESFAALTKAIEAAEALKDDATVADINAAASAITAAIQGLKDKTPAVDTPKPGNNTSATKPSNKTPNVKSQAQKNAEKAMKQAKITKLKVKSKAKKKITVTWKKVSKAKGYQVQVSTNKKFKKSKIILTKTTKKIKLTITKKLKSKKKYFVRVRAYTTYKASNGKTNKVYSDWNKKLRTVKVK